MADEMDLAAELEQAHLQRSISAARQPVVIGVAGECEECGYDSLRLVNRRCAPCRDGRSPHQQRRRLQ